MASPTTYSPEARAAADRAIGNTESVSREPTATEMALAQGAVETIHAKTRQAYMVGGAALLIGGALGFFAGRR